MTDLSKKVIIIAIIIAIALASIGIYVFTKDKPKEAKQRRIEGYEQLDESKYPGYKEKLSAIQKEHPNWTFTILYTDLNWDDVIFNETAGCHSSNLVDSSEGGEGTGEWICPVCGEKVYQVPGWKCTSKIGV